MYKTILSLMASPPPPPPLPSKSSRKMLLAAIAIVIIVIAAIAGAYVLTRPANNNPSTSPSPTSSALPTATPLGSPSGTTSPSTSATPTATSTSGPTSTPSTQSYVGFRNGAWANYTMLGYSAGVASYESHIKESVDEETYNGIPCWRMTMATDQIIEGTKTTSLTKIWMSKSTLQGVHMRMEMNGIVIIDEDLNGTSTTETGTTEIDPSTIVGYETVTVTAGIFTNCAKATTTITAATGTTVSNVWAHESVPIFGLVKMESRLDGQLSSTMELTAYGG